MYVCIDKMCIFATTGHQHVWGQCRTPAELATERVVERLNARNVATVTMFPWRRSKRLKLATTRVVTNFLTF